MSEVVLSLGGNLGDRLAALQAAVERLASYDGLDLREISPVYETAPVGGPPQPDFLNAVAIGETTLAPRELVALTQHVERVLGRVRDTGRWGPRAIDIDVVAYDDVVTDDPVVVLPHPRAAERAFVLAPWLDLDPDALLPNVAPVATLLAGLGTDGVRRRDDLVLRLSAGRR